jgi:hypothetical protein
MKMFYAIHCALITTAFTAALLATALPVFAGSNVSDIGGPNVSDIGGPNVSDIGHSGEARQYSRANARMLADDIDEALAACGSADCPDVLLLLDNAAAILSEETSAIAE